MGDQHPLKRPLPQLNPAIRLHEGPVKPDGTPSWVLHDPAAGSYYTIGWNEFACLSRFQRCDTVAALIESVNHETPLQIDAQDVQGLLQFLDQNGLIGTGPALEQPPVTEQKSALHRLAHGYLFFKIPLLRPQAFLDGTYPYIKPVLSSGFFKVMMAFLIVMIVMTIARAEEFANTFVNLLSLEGAVITFATLVVVKILHEFGHAFTARHYDVSVPAMGVAFMVLYPVLYTETSAAWTLKDKKPRLAIGLSGIATELVLATIALFFWHILPPGVGQQIAFIVVVMALIGSLLVNLNPLMRFDGYFVLSDALGEENLHSRSFAFARWWLREALFDLKEPPPEDVSASRRRFFIVFGWMTLIYRFFLFLGIALLVYWLFFKPLGFILMVLELLYFIALPTIRELARWWERRAQIISRPRARLTAGALAFGLVILFLPISTSVQAPAILYPSPYQEFYPPEDGMIESLSVQEGDRVEKGDALAVIRSPQLDYDIASLRTEIQRFTAMRRASLAGRESEANAGRYSEFESQIAALESRLSDLLAKKERLTIVAPFSGTLLSFREGLREEMSVARTGRLFVLISPESWEIRAFINVQDRDRIETGSSASFRYNDRLFSGYDLQVKQVGDIDAPQLDWPELASVYGGPIPSQFTGQGQDQKIETLRSVYFVDFMMSNLKEKPLSTDKKRKIAQAGYVKIHADPVIPVIRFFDNMTALILREAGLN